MNCLKIVTLCSLVLLSAPAFCGCDEFATKKLNVWLPIDEFKMATADPSNPSSFSARFQNPLTGEVKDLPRGWLVVDYFPVTDETPWVLVQKPSAKHVAVYNYINILTGAVLLSPDNPDLSPLGGADSFSNGKAIVKKTGEERYYILDLDGKLTPVDSHVTWMIEGAGGLFPARVDNSKAAFVNSRGQIVYPTQPGLVPASQQILRVDGFSDGLALFSVGERHGYDPTARFGYMAKDFSWRIPPRFKEADGFVGGRAWAKEDNLWGIIGLNGEWIVAPKFVSKSWGDTSQYFLATEPKLPMRVYDAHGNFVYDLPDEASKFGMNVALINDGRALLSRVDGAQRYFDLETRSWIGTFSYNVTNGFRNGYARITIHGKAENPGGFLPFGEAYLGLDGKVAVFMLRHGDLKQIGLPAGALLEAPK